MEEWFVLADTALKIGLGAAISGVITYKVTNLQHEQQIKTGEIKHSQSIQTTVINRKIDLLEDAMNSFNVCSSNAAMLYGKTNGMLSGYCRRTGHLPEYDEPIPMQENMKQALRPHINGEEFTDMLSNASILETKIRILGLQSALKPLTDLLNYYHSFRNSLYAGDEFPSQEQIDNYRDNIKAEKDTFYSETSIFFNKLHEL